MSNNYHNLSFREYALQFRHPTKDNLCVLYRAMLIEFGAEWEDRNPESAFEVTQYMKDTHSKDCQAGGRYIFCAWRGGRAINNPSGRPSKEDSIKRVNEYNSVRFLLGNLSYFQWSKQHSLIRDIVVKHARLMKMPPPRK